MSSSGSAPRSPSHPAAAGRRPAGRNAAFAPWLAAAGALALGTGLLPGWGAPATINYVPFVGQPLFGAGLLLFAVAVAGSYLDRELLPRAAGEGGATAGRGPLAATLDSHRGLLRLGAASTLLALVVLGVAAVRLRGFAGVGGAAEQLFWGAGHVLQLATVAFVMVAWALLATAGTGRAVAGGRGLRLVQLLVAAAMVAVLLLLGAHPATPRYYQGYVLLMRWGLFPGLVVYLGGVAAPHLRGPRGGTAGEAPGALRPLVASALLMLAGLLFGALIRGSDLRIPGHYHATIGAVTLAYMALTLLLLPGAGGGEAFAARRDRALGRVALLYGTGQLSFSAGLMVAGGYGLGRKTSWSTARPRPGSAGRPPPGRPRRRYLAGGVAGPSPSSVSGATSNRGRSPPLTATGKPVVCDVCGDEPRVMTKDIFQHPDPEAFRAGTRSSRVPSNRPGARFR